MSIKSQRVAYFVIVATGVLTSACGNAMDGDGSTAAVDTPLLEESIGVAVAGPSGAPSITWKHVPKGTILAMTEAREREQLHLDPLPTASVVATCTSNGGICGGCTNNDLWIFDGQWGSSGQVGTTAMICLRSTPSPWDFLPSLAFPSVENGLSWGGMARSAYGPSNSSARFDCNQSVIDPRDSQSKVMFFVNVDEKVNIPCGVSPYYGLTTWTRIPWG
jgi:hypothetical protein